jgi:HSP20 family protein
MLRRDFLTPMDRMETLREQLNQVFEPMLRANGQLRENWMLPLELRETDTDYRVRVMMPGIDPDKINVNVTGKTLVIEGHYDREEHQEGTLLHVDEFQYGKFSRVIEFKDPIVNDAIEANYQNGVLTLTVPKEKEAQKKSVKINVNTTIQP